MRVNESSTPTSKPRMSTRAILIGASFALLFSAVSASALQAGANAPEIGLEDQNGAQVRMSELRGKVVVVDFWASWCGPCRQEIPFLNELQAEFGDDLVIIGVNLDRDEDNMEEFLEDNPMNFRVVHDEGQRVAARYRPERMPSSYIVDRQGVVRHVHLGFEASDRAEFRAHVAELISR